MILLGELSTWEKKTIILKSMQLNVFEVNDFKKRLLQSLKTSLPLTYMSQGFGVHFINISEGLDGKFNIFSTISKIIALHV